MLPVAICCSWTLIILVNGADPNYVGQVRYYLGGEG
jgi:hypothetical protein